MLNPNVLCLIAMDLPADSRKSVRQTHSHRASAHYKKQWFRLNASGAHFNKQVSLHGTTRVLCQPCADSPVKGAWGDVEARQPESELDLSSTLRKHANTVI